MVDLIRIQNLLALCMIVCIVSPMCRAQSGTVKGQVTTIKSGQPPRELQVLLITKDAPPRKARVTARNGTYVIERVSQQSFQIVACAGKNYIPAVENVEIKDGEWPKSIDLQLVYAEDPGNRQRLSGTVTDKSISTVYALAYECQLADAPVNAQGRWEFTQMPKPPEKFAYAIRTKDGKPLKSSAVAAAEKKEVVLKVAVNNAGAPIGLIADLVTAVTIDTSSKGVLAIRVSDPGKALVPGAAVWVTNRETNVTTTLTTNEEGELQATVPMGIYDVRIEGGIGFKATQVDNVLVVGNQANTLDVALDVTHTGATVTVGSDTEDLLASQPLTTVFAELPTRELPLNTRNLSSLLFLSPGVTRTDDSRHAGSFSVNGSSPNATTLIVDSVEVRRDDVLLGLARVETPEMPFEAIAQTTVSLHEQAEFGRHSGGTVSSLTKGGTDEVRGGGFYWNRNATLAARDFFERDKSHFQTHHFGFTIGGPITERELFYFGSYEGKREQQARPRFLSVPSPAALSSARSLLSAQGLGENALSTRLLTFFPQPDRDATFNNRSLNSPAINNADNFVVRLDGGTGKRNVSLIYNFARADQLYPLAPSFIPGFRTAFSGRNQSLTGKLVESLTARDLNELSFRFDRNRENFRPEDHGFDPLTIGLNSGVTDSQRFGLPLIKIVGFDALGSPFDVPTQRVSSNFQVNELFSFIRGPFAVRTGGDFTRARVESNNEAGTRGRIVFDGSILGDPLADFLAGLPSGNTAIVRGDTQRYLTMNFANFFVHYEYRTLPNLTVNFGVRYGLNTSPNEKSNQLSNFIPDAGLVQVGSSSGQLRKLFAKDLNNLAPRVGVAWDPTDSGNVAIRAGWGLYFNNPSLSLFSALCPCPNSPNAGATLNPVGARPAFALSPSGPIPFGPGVPIFSGPALIDLSAVQPNLKNPYVHDFYWGVQIGQPKTLAVETSYSGSIGRNLYRIVDINQPTPGDTHARDSRRPFFSRFPQFGAINQLTSSGKSNYHALVVSVQRRYSGGLWLSGNYTLSKSINDVSHPTELPQNSRDIRAERGLSAFDQRHRFVLSWVYDFGSPGENILLRDWQFSGVFKMASGNPFSPLISFDNSGTATFVDRPNLFSDPRVQGNRTQLYTSTGFRLPSAGTFGNAGRNSLTGPGLNSLDVKLSKRFPFGNDRYFELRTEVFNLFNHPNFRLPNNFVDEPTFGSVVATDPDNGRRRFQFGIRLTF